MERMPRSALVHVLLQHGVQMKLEFSRLIIRDFKDYRGKHVLDFAILGNGLHYIRGSNKVDRLGSNGSGKSSLWDAFLWCLTGRTTRGLRGVDVRTWGETTHAMSRVDFYVEETAHWVKRSTVKNGLWLDGKLCSQDEIDRLIGLNITNLPHTIVLGQKQDLFFDLKPEAKLAVLSETLDLDKWDARSQRARDKVKELKGQHTQLTNQLVTLFEMRDAALDTLNKVKDKSRDWEAERNEGADKRERELAALETAIERAITEKGTHDLAYDSAETELRAARKDLTKKSAERDAIVDAIAQAKVKWAARVHEYDDLKELSTSDTCPTCGQGLHDHKAIARDAKAQLKEAKRKRDLAHDRIIVHETRLELHDKVMTRIRKSIDDFATKSDAAKDKLDRGDRHVQELKLRRTELKAKDRSEEQNPYSETLSDLRKQVKDAKALISENQTLTEAVWRRLERTSYWVGAFKEIRLYLLQETLEELEEVTQNTLPSLGLAGWTVQYDMEREKRDGSIATGLNVKILKPGMDKAVKWEAWSGGEGQRLLIAGAMAFSEVQLRRAGIECDLLVLDEPTRHMSKEGVSETVDYLIEKARDMQVFYVDHQVIESNRFASVVTIEKDNDGSQIKTTAT
jgi:DNA repair exonuclease SbcCD ATPase subunit